MTTQSALPLQSSAAVENEASIPDGRGVRACRRVAIWLFAIAGMVFAMISLGGVTRLTGSGLSITDWRPLLGWLPPLDETTWAALFEQYKYFPEYREVNAGMTLEGFKGIFWLEYLHRLWGRLIGVAFFIPLVIFWLRGDLPGSLKWICLGLFVLGGLQGGLGWYMVQSGLVDEPSVSQYRLAAHLGLALVIYLACLWTALGLWSPPEREGKREGGRTGGLASVAGLLLAFLFLTVVSGAFVAGLDAGLIYNTFPLMGEGVIPADYAGEGAFFANAFENPSAVQFHHRVLGVTAVVAVAGFWVWSGRGERQGRLGGVRHLLITVVLLQAALGLATLLSFVPVSLAALHQAGAVVLLSAALWALHRAARSPAGA